MRLPSGGVSLISLSAVLLYTRGTEHCPAVALVARPSSAPDEPKNRIPKGYLHRHWTLLLRGLFFF